MLAATACVAKHSAVAFTITLQLTGGCLCRLQGAYWQASLPTDATDTQTVRLTLCFPRLLHRMSGLLHRTQTFTSGAGITATIACATPGQMC